MSVDITVNTTETNVNINTSTIVETVDITATVQQDAVEIEVFPNVTVVNVTKKEGQDGQDGTNGVDGTDGQDGQDGEDGKSAYQSYLDTTTDNPPLTEQEWSDSFKFTETDPVFQAWINSNPLNGLITLNDIPDATQIVRGFVNIGTQTFKGNKTIVGGSPTVGNAFQILNSSSTSLVSVGNNGNVSIGAASATNKFTVQVATGYDGIVLNNSSGINIFKIAYDPAGGGYMRLFTNAGLTTSLITATGVSYFNGGNVAIGATTALAKLDVNGNMAIRGLGTAIPAQHILYYTDNGDGTGTIKIKL